MKLMIWIGIAIGSTIGGIAGAAIDGGNWLGAWSIIGTGLGSFVGLWAGYKIGQAYF